MLPPFRSNPLGAAWGPDEPHVPPPTPPPAPDGLAGFRPTVRPGSPSPRGLGSIATQASVAPRGPLVDFLSSFPGMKPAATPHLSQPGHMQSVARRANTAASRNSLVHDYLATA